MANERGQYGNDHSYTASFDAPSFAPRARSSAPPPPRALRSWGWDNLSEAQRADLQRSMAISTIGAVAGAVLWKSHRVWGFILGGMGGGAVGNLIFTPPPP